MNMITFGDSFGNAVSPLELPGHGAMLDTRPPWLRVRP
jgi:hypothetical protein